MDALELAYTPHPALKPRVSRLAAAPARREDNTRGLAVAAVASLALIGAAAVAASPRCEAEAPSLASVERPFERRAVAAPAQAAAAAPLVAAAEPAPVETRAASPLPLVGEALGPEPAPAAASASVAYAPRERHVLTSFDGTRTMTDGPAVVTVAAADPQPQRRAFAPAPVVWNNPVQWISVHKAGL